MANSVDFRVPRTARNSEDYEQLFCDVTEAIWPDGQEAEALAHIAQGTPGQRALFVTTPVARLVQNGGLAGFFGPAGFYCDDVTEGLRLLGAHDMHKAFLEGLSIITKGEAVPMDGEAREGMIYRLSGRAFSHRSRRDGHGRADVSHRRTIDGLLARLSCRTDLSLFVWNILAGANHHARAGVQYVYRRRIFLRAMRLPTSSSSSRVVSWF